MIFVIGGNGFVGSAFGRACETAGREYAVITRQN
jgi:nucleoside-diphosphate-sugar epimerase